MKGRRMKGRMMNEGGMKGGRKEDEGRKMKEGVWEGRCKEGRKMKGRKMKERR